MAECRDQLGYNIPQPNPFDPDSILNPNYIARNCPDPAISIKIRLGDTWYQFNKFYNPPSLEIEENRGFERGKATFRITDSDKYQFNLPFLPLIDLEIEIWNLTENDLFFAGRIAEVEPRSITRRCDGTEVIYFDITCTDKTIDFERIIVSERYENVTTGFIVKDVVKRFTLFDDSDIDPLIGQTVVDYRVNLKYPAQIIQEILQLEPTWTFWVDLQTNRPQIGETSATYNTIINATEPNVYTIFDLPTLMLSADNSIVKNSVLFIYNQAYRIGTCSIATGDTILFGQGTNWLDFVTEGAEIRINNDDAVYTVERVISDLEIRLGSAYQEDPVTAVPYEISGIKSAIQIEDQASIERMALLNNETGPLAGRYEMVAPQDDGNYTREEAALIANSYLIRYTEPLITGRATSDNSKISLRSLHAGQVINFNLPVSRSVIADVVIQRLVKKDTGAMLCRIDTTPGEDRIDPLFRYDFDFKDRIFDARNQIKKLLADVRRLRVAGTDEIFLNKIVAERLFVDDCVELVEPIGGSCELLINSLVSFVDPLTLQNELEISDSITLTSPPSGPYYTTPTARQAGYCIGANNFGFCS